MTLSTALAKKPPSAPPADALKELSVTHNFTLGRPFHIRVVPDGSALLFLRSPARQAKASLFEHNVASGKERLLLSAEQLLGGETEKLSAAEKAIRERKRIKLSGFTGFTLTPDGKKIVVKLSGRIFLYDRASQRSTELKIPKGVVLDPRLSPKGDRLAFVKDNNLYVMSLKGRAKALTRDGTETKPHGLAEFVAQEEMSRYHGYWWAPDGKKLLYQSNDYSSIEQFTIADASRPEKDAHQFPYPRPGRDNADVRLTITDLSGRKKVQVKWNRKQFPYLTKVTWPNEGPLSMIVQSRDQKVQRFLAIDPSTGRTSKLFEEKDEAWLNIHDSTPWWIGGGSYLWATEEKGEWQLELHRIKKNPKTGVFKGPVARQTIVSSGFHQLVHVDKERDRVWFSGGPNPIYTHLYYTSLKGGDVEQVSMEPGDHHAVFSKDGSTYTLTQTALDLMPTTRVYRTDVGAPKPRTNKLKEVAVEPKRRPKVELIQPQKATDFYSAIVRPTSFDPKKKYPVVLYVYGGPGFNIVRSSMTSYFMQQWIADHGFVVVSIDGRGTPRRGRAFERALYQRFESVPLDDQVKGLRALGRRYPEMDMDRVGVYGWSFGGYMAALSVLKRPDVFKVGVSGAPVVDWLYYDTHYTERYLGLPTDSQAPYDRANLIRYAPKLKRPLMLIHGIADDNVYFAHTLQLADALFREGKSFELLPLVGLTHQVADPKIREVLYKRIVNFLGAALW